MGELEKSALLFSLDDVGCKFVRHFLRGDDESLGIDGIFDIIQKIML
jgi:hypothetical protein